MVSFCTWDLCGNIVVGPNTGDLRGLGYARPPSGREPFHADQRPGLPEGLADALHLDHGATNPANQCVRDPPGLASFTFDEAQPTAHAHSPGTRSPTGSAPPKDRRKYCDPGEQE